MGLPEIEYQVHKNADSWRVFYGDVKVSAKRVAACRTANAFAFAFADVKCGVRLAGAAAGALEEDGHNDKGGAVVTTRGTCGRVM